MVYWDADDRKDLLAGIADGTLKIYLNIGTDDAPHFDGGTFLQVGAPGSKTDIDVGSRATPTAVDWNNDGRKDLVVGGLDGKIRIFVNEGTDTGPDFLTEEFAPENGVDLVVPSARSSPHVLDLDDDGKKDLLVGNTEGQLLFYSNAATDNAPSFSGYVLVGADGVPIDLPGTPRSRPFVCDWTGDGFLDVLVGAGDGLVRLYEGLDATAVAGGAGPPFLRAARLMAPYPNPFNPQVTVPFILPSAAHVLLSVYDVEGRCVRRLVDGDLAGGPYRVMWLGVDENGIVLPSGVYVVRMEAGGASQTAKLLLLR